MISIFQQKGNDTHNAKTYPRYCYHISWLKSTYFWYYY